MSNEFVTGQRWVSNTEPELGLGVVLEAKGRRVTLSFPVVEEERTYASNNCPLSRVKYRVGDTVHDDFDNSFVVSKALDNGGFMIYFCHDEQGEDVVLPEHDLTSHVQFSSPKERLFSGLIDSPRSYQLRHAGLLHKGRLAQLHSRGLLGGRVQLLPHQLYIAHQVANRHAPRVLLADEVGLGKTIEAGLIIHQQLVTGRAQRILIMVSDSLVHQWLVEMLRRFNLMFTILDEERCIALEERDAEDVMAEQASVARINPFETAQLVLCSNTLFADNSLRHNQALACQWDLLIVDEAHHLEWTPEHASLAYQQVAALAAVARGLLLLTATPEQLGVEGHFARLRLLDPDRYYDLQKFIAEEQGYAALNDVIQQLREPTAAQTLLTHQTLQDQIAAYIGAELLAPQLELAATDLAAAVNHLTDMLLDHHGTGRVLFRNTRASVGGFPQRQLHEYALPMSEAVASVVVDNDLQLQLHPENHFGDGWEADDARVQWLVDWVAEHKHEKALVICAQASTALALETWLRLREGIRTSVFHEDMSIIERDRAGAYFADTDGGAQVLICSEIGSEGRNFQFSQHLILFDLPLNPDLLEQRIGRLDRIGQQGIVNIHVPYFVGSAQERLLTWYHRGLNVFARPFPAGNEVYQHFAERLIPALQNQGDAFAELVVDTQAYVAATLKRLDGGRSRLLELNACHPDEAQRLVAEITELEATDVLPKFMDMVFDQYGVNQEEHSEDAIILRPSDEMQGNYFPSLAEDGMTATYDRSTAASRDDMQFLTWEHPMVTGALDLLVNGEKGNACFATLKARGLPAGTILVESLFSVYCAAPKSMQIERYLPVEPIRVLFDNQGRNLTSKLSAEQLHGAVKKIPKQTAREAVRMARSELEKTIALVDARANEQLPKIVTNAVQTMHELQDVELERLQALAAINPNIRASEITWQTDYISQLQTYLETAQLKAEGIRLVVITG